MFEALDARRKHSDQKLRELRGRLDSAEGLVFDKACVYVTGSFGREEACAHSDLDLFIVGHTDGGDPPKRLLTRLDEICLKAQLIQSVRDLEFPEFSGDGEYLEHYSVEQLVRSLGTPEDDATNTFTARLLLILESRALIGGRAYQDAVDGVIAAYWRDYTDHQNDFLPAYLTNDILRLWRTFCVNYEARTQTEPDLRRQKRRLKSYKLKHSRLLTCYSALLYLMAVWNKKQSVSPDDARRMVSLTPTERIEELRAMASLAAAAEPLAIVLDRYSIFLQRTNVAEEELLQQIADSDTRHAMFSAAADFGEAVYDAMTAIGGNSRFHRMLVV